jgi:hypothetical protein
LDANGYSEPLKLKAGTYYVREEDATPGSGYQTKLLCIMRWYGCCSNMNGSTAIRCTGDN